MQEQPQPKENTNPHIADLVIEDMKIRKELGIKRYGTALQAFNGRDALQDLYEEQLDQIVYTKQWMVEKQQIRRDLVEILNYLNTLDFPDPQEKDIIKNQLIQVIYKIQINDNTCRLAD